MRVFDNLYPALERDGCAAAERDAKPDLFTAVPARGAHEVIVNSRRPVDRARRARRGRARAGSRGLASADARARRTPRACTSASTRATAAARRSPAHARPALALDFVPALIARERERFARLRRRGRWAQQPARRPGRRGGAPARARRRDRRRGGPARALRCLASLPADARRRAGRGALRGRRPSGREPAARRAGPARASARRAPAAQPVGANRAARRRALLLAHRHRAAARRTSPASSSGRGLHLNSVAPERAAAELRAA